jgi:hypothetical protein
VHTHPFGRAICTILAALMVAIIVRCYQTRRISYKGVTWTLEGNPVQFPVFMIVYVAVTIYFATAALGYDPETLLAWFLER